MWTQIATDAIRDRLSAEIWTGYGWEDDDAELVAEVFVDGDRVLVELYGTIVNAQEFHEALLTAMRRITVGD